MMRALIDVCGPARMPSEPSEDSGNPCRRFFYNVETFSTQAGNGAIFSHHHESRAGVPSFGGVVGVCRDVLENFKRCFAIVSDGVIGGLGQVLETVDCGLHGGLVKSKV